MKHHELVIAATTTSHISQKHYSTMFEFSFRDLNRVLSFSRESMIDKKIFAVKHYCLFSNNAYFW